VHLAGFICEIIQLPFQLTPRASFPASRVIEAWSSKLASN